jgi:hypothetical protein
MPPSVLPAIALRANILPAVLRDVLWDFKQTIARYFQLEYLSEHSRSLHASRRLRVYSGWIALRAATPNPHKPRAGSVNKFWLWCLRFNILL